MKIRNHSTAMLLCIFLGWLSADRFYLGYVGVGIFRLILMATGIGEIWQLIDFIKLLTGSYKPAPGYIWDTDVNNDNKTIIIQK